MTKNTTGGKGHKSQRADNPKAMKNRRLGDMWISDLGNTFPEGTLLGRVMKRLGNGRMEVFAQDEKKKFHESLNVPLRGGMTGRAKGSCWVDVGKLVLISATGLAGTPYEIFTVLEPQQVSALKKFDILNPRFFIPMDSAQDEEEAGYDFESDDEEDVDVDAV